MLHKCYASVTQVLRKCDASVDASVTQRSYNVTINNGTKILYALVINVLYSNKIRDGDEEKSFARLKSCDATVTQL
jgi:hypothetical protein